MVASFRTDVLEKTARQNKPRGRISYLRKCQSARWNDTGASTTEQSRETTEINQRRHLCPWPSHTNDQCHSCSRMLAQTKSTSITPTFRPHDERIPTTHRCHAYPSTCIPKPSHHSQITRSQIRCTIYTSKEHDQIYGITLRPYNTRRQKKALPQDVFNQTTLNRDALSTFDIKPKPRSPRLETSVLPTASCLAPVGDLLACRVGEGNSVL